MNNGLTHKGIRSAFLKAVRPEYDKLKKEYIENVLWECQKKEKGALRPVDKYLRQRAENTLGKFCRKYKCRFPVEVKRKLGLVEDPNHRVENNPIPTDQ